MAGLANVVGDPAVAQAARQKYVMAISKTNETLCSSVKAVEDTSLMGIMTLSLFEVSLAPDHIFSFRSRVDRLATCFNTVPVSASVLALNMKLTTELRV